MQSVNSMNSENIMNLEKKASPLISVIVPVYNVEDYLDQCVSSIVKQTYHNLEIILVDDGSKDRSGAICDAWEHSDNRIRVIHQKNRGLSGARNTGIEQSHGEFIAFVDSDDYIYSSMYQCLLSELVRTKVELVVCSYDTLYENGRIEHPKEEKSQIYSGLDFAFWTVGPGKSSITSSVWKMLFSKKIIGNIRFDEGRYYEDMFFMMQVLWNTTNVSYIHYPLYVYRIRESSITNTKISKKHIDDTIFLKLRMLDFTKNESKEKRSWVENAVSLGMRNNYAAFYPTLTAEQKCIILETLKTIHFKYDRRCFDNYGEYIHKKYFMMLLSRLKCNIKKGLKVINCKEKET